MSRETELKACPFFQLSCVVFPRRGCQNITRSRVRGLLCGWEVKNSLCGRTLIIVIMDGDIFSTSGFVSTSTVSCRKVPNGNAYNVWTVEFLILLWCSISQGWDRCCLVASSKRGAPGTEGAGHPLTHHRVDRAEDRASLWTDDLLLSELRGMSGQLPKWAFILLVGIVLMNDRQSLF